MLPLASRPLAAFPMWKAGRLPHHRFWGLLGIHFEPVRGSEGAYERARCHYWRNSRRGYAFGAAGGALIMLAGIDATAAGLPK